MVEANLVKRSRISSSCTIASTLTDAAKDIPPTPFPTANEEYDIAQKFYDLTIPSQKALPDDNECNNDNDDEKYRKFAQRTRQPLPLLPLLRQMKLSRGNVTYPSHIKRQFLTTINVTIMTKKR